MVAVKSSEAQRYLLRPPEHVPVYLVYGSDAGLISERVRHILNLAVPDPSDPFQLARLNGDDIAVDPLRLLDEANTIPLFGGRRAILIDLGSKNITPALEMLLAAPPADCTIVIEAGSLRADAPLRTLLERDRSSAVIECNPDDSRAVEHLIRETLAKANLRIDDDAHDALGLMLGADRLTTRAELEKLALYCHGRGNVTLQDIRNIIANASGLVLNEAVNGAFSGNMAAIDETATRAFALGNDANALLGAALWHAVAMHRGRNSREGTGSGQRSGSGFGRGTAQNGQLQNWGAPQLQRCIALVQEAIGKCRRDPGLADIIAIRALFSIAQLGREKRR